jgi:hypothetical protein
MLRTSHAAKATSDVTQRAVFEADVRASPTLKTLLDRTWPTVTASQVLRRLYGPGVRPPTSVRRTGEPPTITGVPPERLAESAARVASALAGRWALTGVVVPDSLHDEASVALNTAALTARDL